MILLSVADATFLEQPHAGVFTTIRPDGSPHVAPVRFTWDDDEGLARVMTRSATRKVRNLLAVPESRVAICQVWGPRWVTLEGTATVSDDPDRVAEGARRYAARYGMLPPEPPGRVVIEIAVDRVMTLPW